MDASITGFEMMGAEVRASGIVALRNIHLTVIVADVLGRGYIVLNYSSRTTPSPVKAAVLIIVVVKYIGHISTDNKGFH